MTREARGRTEPDFLYFAYGSNLDAEQMKGTCKSAELVAVARLRGHALRFKRYSPKWHGGVADIRPDSGEEVWGAVWRIPAGEAAALDRREGVPTAYCRYEVTVETPDGRARVCRAYQVVTPEAEHIPPSRAYRETMLRGARACGLPSNYVERLAAIQDTGAGGDGPA